MTYKEIQKNHLGDAGAKKWVYSDQSGHPGDIYQRQGLSSIRKQAAIWAGLGDISLGEPATAEDSQEWLLGG
jgi:hypothetical protein